MSEPREYFDRIVSALYDEETAFITALEQHRSGIANLPNVVGLAVGYQETGGQRSTIIGPIVLVSQKIAPTEISPGEIIPQYVTLNGVNHRIDVIEAPRLTPLCAPGDPSVQCQEHTPMPGGVQICRKEPGTEQLGNPGTSGLLVERMGPPVRRFMLTAAHVIPQGFEVVHPLDPNKVVGGYVEHRPDPIDASLFVGEAPYKSGVICFGAVPQRPLDPIIGMRIKKSGARTGVTSSQIVRRQKQGLFDIDNLATSPDGGWYVSGGDSGSVCLLGSDQDPNDFGRFNELIERAIELQGPLSPGEADQMREELRTQGRNRAVGMNLSVGAPTTTQVVASAMSLSRTLRELNVKIAVS